MRNPMILSQENGADALGAAASAAGAKAGRFASHWHLAAACLAAALAGCAADRAVVSSIPPADARDRHPIILTQAPTTVEIFPSGSSLDQHAAARIEGLVHDARQNSTNVQGYEALFPVGGINTRDPRAALPAIRRALSSAGAKGNLSVGSYPVANPNEAGPVRISYISLKAKVATQCGQWPSDLASGGNLEGFENRQYYNFGCANQSFLAAQISNASDLAEPRASNNGDVEMRIRAIGKVRQGTDPGTTWIVKNTAINGVGN